MKTGSVLTWKICYFLAACVLMSSAGLAAEVTVEAYAGKPFGVGVATQRRFENPSAIKWDESFEVTDADGRIRYPVLRATLQAAETPKPVLELRHYFLIQGDEPLTVKSVEGEPIGITVELQRNETKHQQLQLDWWNARRERETSLADWNGPPLPVSTYVNAMLSQRLHLEPIKPRRFRYGMGDEVISFFLGTESIRAAMQEQRLLNPNVGIAKADQPVPKGITIPAVPVPPIPDNVVVEPIARHVPAECFYLRCGSYSNFAWLRQTLDQWGGNLREIIANRSIDYSLRERLEQQLALRETQLAKALGDVLVKDIALIGNDTFLREGASIGLLMQSNKNALLHAAIAQQRAAAKAADARVTLQTISIAGHDVSFLSTPDNQVRSFYAVDGDFHLVTNSKQLVKRFFEAGDGKQNLAELDEFRYARSQHPLTDPSVALLHLSDEFFRNLLSPQYRIEMTRRMAADVDLETLELARLAAQGEHAKSESIDDLQRGGFLPAGLQQRPDGSHVVIEPQRNVDSLRGARGSFMPIPDVEITHATAQEVTAYEEFRRDYARVWQRVDPVTINIAKQAIPEKPGRERVVLDIRICPVSIAKYGFLGNMLSPAQKQKMAHIPGALFEIQTRGLKLVDPGHIVVGALDDDLPFTVRNGHVEVEMPKRNVDPLFFIAGRGKTTEDVLRNAKPVNERDYQATGWVNWHRLEKDFWIGAMKQESLDRISPHLKIETAERAAQIWLHLEDVSQAQIFKRIRAESFLHDARATTGSLHVLNELTQQLRVPVGETQTASLRVMNGRLACSLGGELKHEVGTGTFARWRSSAFPETSLKNVNAIPDNYRNRLLEWWHGLELEFTLEGQTLQVRAELELQP